MHRVLNVAEKNDAAKSLARLLSKNSASMREGFSRFNKIYEFNYQLFNQPAQMIFTSVSGHIMNSDFTAAHNSWYEKKMFITNADKAQVDPVVLFDAPVQKKITDRAADIEKTIKREIIKCQTLIIWTDCDREGENIGYEIINLCRPLKTGLKIYRARFSEITYDSAVRALLNLIQPDERISAAVDVRQELDLRIGAAFTRFQTLRLQRLFGFDSKQIISYGSCQFPTLGFIVERYLQRENFIREPFWKIIVEHQIENNQFCEFTWERNRLFEHQPCLMIYDMIMDEPLAKVIDIKSKNKSKWRPTALDTVEMEKLASRKLRMTGKKTMDIAEKLYMKGLISYPRTETNIFPSEINLHPLIQNQINDQRWGAFAQRVLNDGPRPRNGKNTDKAHPPIHPIRYPDGQLTDEENKLYELIVRHFLGCVSKDAQGDETIIKINISNEIFHASGLIIRERNYLDVYIYDKWSEKELPHYELNQTFYPTKIEMIQGETSPPQLLTEADLIALMEKHGIGTDATHAEHIAKIQERLYTKMNSDRRFEPEKLGLGLCEGYDKMGHALSKPHLRSELENQLKAICEGRANPADVLREQIDKYRQVFIVTAAQIQKLDDAMTKYFGPPGQNPPPPPPPRPPPSGPFGDRTNRNQPPSERTNSLNRPLQVSRNNNNNQSARPQQLNRPARPLQQEQIRPTNNNNVPKCNCNVDAKELTVKKDGPNKGRSFFRCGNNDNCNFFAWKDNTTSNHVGNNQRQYGDNQSNTTHQRRQSDNDEDGKQRKCGLCKQTGHTRRNCPSLNL
ncbi:unnamed protein product [Rotaria sordida]|uniref:DNA topoisomerase n=1 Tax=Rotaria sordida TaxID=392033 RepID=A0A814N1K3_9BILA|nr:unnamed protein product [Rotaria sordida]